MADEARIAAVVAVDPRVLSRPYVARLLAVADEVQASEARHWKAMHDQQVHLKRDLHDRYEAARKALEVQASEAEQLRRLLTVTLADFSDAVDRCAEIDGHAAASVEFWRSQIDAARALAGSVEPTQDATRKAVAALMGRWDMRARERKPATWNEAINELREVTGVVAGVGYDLTDYDRTFDDEHDGSVLRAASVDVEDGTPEVES